MCGGGGLGFREGFRSLASSPSSRDASDLRDYRSHQAIYIAVTSQETWASQLHVETGDIAILASSSSLYHQALVDEDVGDGRRAESTPQLVSDERTTGRLPEPRPINSNAEFGHKRPSSIPPRVSSILSQARLPKRASTQTATNTASTSMSIDARKTSEKDWKYVSEGGATIVFSYIGPQSEDLTGMVLRLRKAKLADLEDVVASQDEDKEYNAEVDDSTVSFQARVTSRLVPPANLPKLVPCRVSFSLLSSLSNASAKIRPSKRNSTDAIDTRKRRAVLATDLIGFESGSNGATPRSFAVEIKPKWAFSPNPNYLSPQTRDVKTRHSRFVMHSYYRTYSGHSKPEAESTYDPLDLFSGEAPRIEKAVTSLWDSWVRSSGSANNLKIFIGGKTVDPASVGTVAHEIHEPRAQFVLSY